MSELELIKNIIEAHDDNPKKCPYCFRKLKPKLVKGRNVVDYYCSVCERLIDLNWDYLHAISLKVEKYSVFEDNSYTEKIYNGTVNIQESKLIPIYENITNCFISNITNEENCTTSEQVVNYTEEFYNIMQAYSHTPFSNQEEVIYCYELVKKFIRKHFIQKNKEK